MNKPIVVTLPDKGGQLLISPTPSNEDVPRFDYRTEPHHVWTPLDAYSSSARVEVRDA